MFAVAITLLCSIVTLLQQGSTINKDNSALIPIVLIGIGYSVYETAYWVSIAYTVPKRLAGTAYGLSTCLGGALAGLTGPLIVAELQAHDIYDGV